MQTNHIGELLQRLCIMQIIIVMYIGSMSLSLQTYHKVCLCYIVTISLELNNGILFKAFFAVFTQLTVSGDTQSMQSALPLVVEERNKDSQP